MPFRRTLLMLGMLLPTLSGVFVFTACQPEKEASAQNAAPVAAAEATLTAQDWIPLTIERITIRAQFAISPSEMARGLMHRKELAENDGMLFVYDKPRQMSFWMKNTPLPLDIGFFSADGVLREVYRMFPYDTTTVSSVSNEIQFALEMNQGWFAKNGLKPGARLSMEQLKEGLRQRGYDLKKYGL